ncbi:MAG: MAPEG family protein [Methylomonas sp.]|jgi:uncharacterized MAPEG superfamily protein
MNASITPELYWLILTLVMTALFWIPTIINRIVETGPWATLNTPSLSPRAAWAERLRRAHTNAVENLAIFAPLVLAVQFSGAGAAATASVCMAYFFARLAHVISYALGIPVLRTLAFSAGFICQMLLAAALLNLAR